MDPKIAEIEKEYERDDLPAFEAGDTVRVRIQVREGDKTRIQPFEGICIAKKGSGVSQTFTVRKISGGVGVERIFPLHSPAIESVEVVRRGSVRRAKLYYLRGRRGKKARVREKAWWLEQEEERADAAEGAGGARGEAAAAADEDASAETGDSAGEAAGAGETEPPGPEAAE